MEIEMKGLIATLFGKRMVFNQLIYNDI